MAVPLKMRDNIENDSFFQPKDIEKREKEEEGRRKEFSSKIKLGLQNIKSDYENGNWNCRHEELFLQIFSKLNLDEIYNENVDLWILKNEKSERGYAFNCVYYTFYVSYKHFWKFFKQEIKCEYEDIYLFMEIMLKKYFKLSEFTLGIYYSNRQEHMKSDFKIGGFIC